MPSPTIRSTVGGDATSSKPTGQLMYLGRLYKTAGRHVHWRSLNQPADDGSAIQIASFCPMTVYLSVLQPFQTDLRLVEEFTDTRLEPEVCNNSSGSYSPAVE